MIFLKEGYLFIRNLYGLLTHPFKTIVRIRKKPDWSQTILTLGLPIWGGTGILITALVLFLIWQPIDETAINLISLVVFLVLIGILIFSGYISYWASKYLTSKRI